MSFWAERPKREKRLIIVFGVVVLLAGMKLMASGSEAPASPPPQAAPAPSEPVVTDTGDSPPAEQKAKKEKHPKGPGSNRDPFEPLIDVDALTAEESGTTSSGSSTKVIDVELVDVFEDNGNFVAVIDVDTERYRGKVGKTVGEQVEIMELDDHCGVFATGDDVFRLCVGQSVERSV